MWLFVELPHAWSSVICSHCSVIQPLNKSQVLAVTVYGPEGGGGIGERLFFGGETTTSASVLPCPARPLDVGEGFEDGAGMICLVMQ